MINLPTHLTISMFTDDQIKKILTEIGVNNSSKITRIYLLGETIGIVAIYNQDGLVFRDVKKDIK